MHSPAMKVMKAMKNAKQAAAPARAMKAMSKAIVNISVLKHTEFTNSSIPGLLLIVYFCIGRRAVGSSAGGAGYEAGQGPCYEAGQGNSDLKF